MLNLKGNINLMKSLNIEGSFDKAISKQRGALRFFMTAPRFRSELPEAEEQEGQLAA
jgi:hypothetical protein